MEAIEVIMLSSDEDQPNEWFQNENDCNSENKSFKPEISDSESDPQISNFTVNLKQEPQTLDESERDITIIYPDIRNINAIINLSSDDEEIICEFKNEKNMHDEKTTRKRKIQTNVQSSRRSMSHEEQPDKKLKIVTSEYETVPQLIASQIQKPVAPKITQYEARSMNLYNYFNYEKFLAIILKLNIECLDADSTQPPPFGFGNKVFQYVSSHYKTFNDHFKTYFPLMLLETWERIHRDWSKNKLNLKSNETFFVISKTCTSDNTMKKVLCTISLETIVEHEHLDQLSNLKTGMLITMKAVNVENNYYKWLPIFGYISEWNCSNFFQKPNEVAIFAAFPAVNKPNAQRFRLTVKIPTKNVKPALNKKLHIQHIMYLKPAIREASSLIHLQKSDLAKLILTPERNLMTTKIFLEEKFVPIDKYNMTQTKAILDAAYLGLLPESVPKIVLLQGPPGTGKTHTCIGLIQQLLYGKGSIPNGPRRLLVLAPSNAAVDVIAIRLVELKKKLEALNSPKRLTFVRVGLPDLIHNDIKQFSVDEVATDSLVKQNRIDEDLLVEKINVLKANLDSNNACITGKSMLKINARVNREIKKLENKRLELNMCNSTINLRKKNPQTRNLIMKHKNQTIMTCDIILTTLASCHQPLIENAFGPKRPKDKEKQLKFTSCIVDEASQCCEPDLLLPLKYKISKLILIGDPKQLPPTVLSLKASMYKYTKSTFERFFDYYKDRESPIIMLNEQFRMHSEICSFPSRYFYSGLLNTHSEIDYEFKTFPLKPYVMLDIKDSLETNCQEAISYHNINEAKVINNLCQEILKLVPSDCSIGVITPYQGQRKLLMSNAYSSLREVEINTVDGFQGREKDIIILSCVRANEPSIGFLKCPQRLNVAITRARKCLIICGHLNSLVKHDHWINLIEDANSRNLVFKIKSTDSIRKVSKFIKQ